MNFIIGIDPDINKSGVAISKDGKIQELECLNFIYLQSFLVGNKDKIKKVYLEAGWLNKKASWHDSPNKQTAGRVGYKVGQNHQIGMVIEQVLKHHEIPYQLVRPTQSKRDHKDFCILTKWDKNIKTNQEKRDAGMIILGYKQAVLI